MRTGKDRVQLDATNVPFRSAASGSNRATLLRGDADGVVVIPKAFEDRVLDKAEEVTVVEDRIREAARGGMRLSEARKQFGYHNLQTKK